MANIHWDYADAFTGRDAAYLIAGLDPSSSGAEEAYRAQPVIHKLKKAYYYACSSISKELRKEYEYEYTDTEYWSWLIRYEKNPSQIFSVEVEAMFSNFNSSEYVRKYLPEIAGVLEVTRKGHAPYLEYDKIKAQWDIISDLIREKLESGNPSGFVRRTEIFRELEQLKKSHDNGEIIFSEYWQKKNPLETERDELWENASKIFKEFNPIKYAEYSEVRTKLDKLIDEASDWTDVRSSTFNKLTERAWESYRASLAEGEAWLNGESHEFDDQKFNRTELRRWIVENGLPSQYQFASLRTGQSSPDNGGLYGGHTTALLATLSKAAAKWWANFDPSDPTSAPTNETVIAWLVDEGVSRRIAETMATILRADGLPAGRRT